MSQDRINAIIRQKSRLWRFFALKRIIKITVFSLSAIIASEMCDLSQLVSIERADLRMPGAHAFILEVEMVLSKGVRTVGAAICALSFLTSSAVHALDSKRYVVDLKWFDGVAQEWQVSLLGTEDQIAVLRTGESKTYVAGVESTGNTVGMRAGEMFLGRTVSVVPSDRAGAGKVLLHLSVANNKLKSIRTVQMSGVNMEVPEILRDAYESQIVVPLDQEVSIPRGDAKSLKVLVRSAPATADIRAEDVATPPGPNQTFRTTGEKFVGGPIVISQTSEALAPGVIQAHGACPVGYFTRDSDGGLLACVDGARGGESL